jgi:4,5-DOPA dioxygenase extradiol
MSPALFISHGAPTLAIEDTPATRFLKTLSQAFERPKAILVASAHWETPAPTVNAVERNDTIHDFSGFPRKLYQLRYRAPGSRELAERVAALLGEAGLSVETDTARGLDHGAWIPLIMMYPAANIPVVQLSVQSRLGPRHHYRVGRSLASLRAEGVLIMGSGSFTHNLAAVEWCDADAAVPEWVTEFSNWMRDAIMEARVDELLDYRARAPFACENHPTEEHLLPLFVAIGAAENTPADRGKQICARHLHHSVTMATIGMDAFSFS